jgi:ABC-type multidrug transport system fused ATPase/permease subunit
MQSSRELKRLEGLSRSPIYSSCSEMLQGIETIRAFHRQADFVEQHIESIDHNSSLFALFWLTSRWLAIRLDFLATLIMVALSFLAAVLVESGRFDIISPAMLSLALIYCLQLTGLLQWTMRMVIETEVGT